MRGQRALISCFILAATMLLWLPAALAQGVPVFGEARMHGKTYLKSAGGQWVAAPTTYPVVQDTALRTEEGSADVYFRDGSRVSFSRHSEADVSGSQGQYLISLMKGSVAFSVAPGASLSVAAGSASVAVNGGGKIARKVSYQAPGHTRGVVTLGKKGIEVRSLDGAVTVAINSAVVRDLGAGEAMVIARDNSYRVVMAQALKDTAKDEDDDNKKGALIPGSSDAAGAAAVGGAAGGGGSAYAQGGVLVVFGGGLAYAIKEGFSSSPGYASPSSPSAQRRR